MAKSGPSSRRVRCPPLPPCSIPLGTSSLTIPFFPFNLAHTRNSVSSPCQQRKGRALFCYPSDSHCLSTKMSSISAGPRAGSSSHHPNRSPSQEGPPGSQSCSEFHELPVILRTLPFCSPEKSIDFLKWKESILSACGRDCGISSYCQ